MPSKEHVAVISIALHRVAARPIVWVALSLWLAPWQASQADWAVLGAQYRCDAQKETFTLLPHTETSENENPPLQQGYSKLPNGNNQLACAFGSRGLNADIEIFPPAARGMCMGVGYIRVNSITVKGVELLSQDITFNWSCSGEPPIIRVQVFNHPSAVELQTCTGPPDSFEEFPKDPRCYSESFDVDRMAIAEAKAAHDLADARTQVRTSALRLAPEYDLAREFGNDSVDGRSLCTHWSSIFLNAITNPERQTYGRIAGVQGERVYLRRAHPVRCATDQDDGCGKHSYVIPGDRVDIGFICGDWTMVQYRTRVRTKPAIEGWVETSRLYGLQSLPAVGSALKHEGIVTAAPAKDALARAAALQDAATVRALLADGHPADGDETDGEPLFQATRVANAEIARLLLQSGANPGAHSASGDPCRILREGLRNEEVFAVLKEAGINPNCQSEKFTKQSVLMDIAQYNRLWAWERIHDESRNPNERLIDPMSMATRLIKAGADIEVHDDWGRTALFFAIAPNNVDIAALLLSAGANPNATVEVTDTGRLVAQQIGSTPLMASLNSYSATLDPTMLQLLLRHGANPNFRNALRYDAEMDSTTGGAVTFAGQTALTRAAQDGQYTAVRLLLEHGADPTIPREDGKTPATLASEYKHPDIAALLKQYDLGSQQAQ